MKIERRISFRVQKDAVDQRSGGAIVFSHIRLLPVCDEVIHCLAFVAIHKAEVTDAALGHTDQAFSERRGVDAVTDGQACALRFVFSGSHGFGGDEEIMQPSQARKPDLMCGLQQVLRFAQQFLGVFARQELHEAFGTDARPAREGALEVILAQPDGGSDLFQIGLALYIGFDELDGLFDQMIMLVRFKLLVHINLLLLHEIVWGRDGVDDPFLAHFSRFFLSVERGYSKT